MTIKAIIFDFDGLILDTETPDFSAWKSVFDKYQIPFPLDEYMAGIGRTYNDHGPIEYILSHTNESLTENIILDDFNQLRDEFIDKETLCDGILEYLKAAKDLNLLIGLASSSKSEWVVPHLENFEIRDYFDVISTLDFVSLPKPDPELYSRTLDLLSIKPSEAIALEDSCNGILAAKAAGLYAIAIPNQVTKISDFSHADMCLKSLTDMRLSELVENFSTR